MNKEIKKRWLDALRSGAYPKGTGSLRWLNGEYCCLGVLHEVVTGEQAPHQSTASIDVMKRAGLTKRKFLFGPVEEIVRAVPKPFSGYAHKTNIGRILATINDSNDTFDPVIEYIEENL